MLNNKHIAIISPNTLINVGLKQLLHEYFDIVHITVYNCVDPFFKDHPECFDFYFISPDLFLMNYDFFLPRKNRSVILSDKSFDSKQFMVLEQTDDLCLLIDSLQNYFTECEKQNSSDSQEELSPREIEVLKLVALGNINKEIADRLNISFNTVLSHRKNINAKLGIKTVSGLTYYAMMNGYVNNIE